MTSEGRQKVSVGEVFKLTPLLPIVFQVYIYKGELHIIPVPQSPTDDAMFPQTINSIGDAIECVRTYPDQTRVSKKIQSAINKRLSRYLWIVYCSTLSTMSLVWFGVQWKWSQLNECMFICVLVTISVSINEGLYDTITFNKSQCSVYRNYIITVKTMYTFTQNEMFITVKQHCSVYMCTNDNPSCLTNDVYCWPIFDDRFPDLMKEHVHHTHCYIPASIGAILDERPQLLAPAVRAFYYRDPSDLRVGCNVLYLFQMTI